MLSASLIVISFWLQEELRVCSYNSWSNISLEIYTVNEGTSQKWIEEEKEETVKIEFYSTKLTKLYI